MAYTKIQHEERLRFGLSCNDYCVADSICNLSNNDKNSYGWCYMTRTNLGESLGLTKQAILNIIEKLVKAELVEIHAETKYLRPTVLWYKNFTNGKENLPESNNFKVKKVYRSGKESLLSSGKESLLYIENITLKETIKRLKEESEFSKNENLALLSENEFIKSELEKAKELIKALEEKPKTPIKKDVKIFDELVYDFPQDFSDETKDLFMKFLANRKKMKKEVKTQRALNGLIEKLKPFADNVRIIAIDNSINANWMDLFPKPEDRSTFDHSKQSRNNGFNPNIPRVIAQYVYDNSKD